MNEKSAKLEENKNSQKHTRIYSGEELKIKQVEKEGIERRNSETRAGIRASEKHHARETISQIAYYARKGIRGSEMGASSISLTRSFALSPEQKKRKQVRERERERVEGARKGGKGLENDKVRGEEKN